ncbi:MAG: GNAT family N-acetyltransferase [Eubacterium sp.]|nr:GNAT family N-acetyltransferase [Eubacterium sp.]
MADIKFITAQDRDFKIVKAIRTAVFTNEQGADADKEFDELDNFSDFALLYDGENAVATARVVEISKGYKIGRIAVLKEYRGKGYGEDIVRSVTEKAFDNGADKVYVDAQNYAVPFYEKIGFKVIGEELFDRGLPHTPMSVTKEEYYGKEKE